MNLRSVFRLIVEGESDFEKKGKELLTSGWKIKISNYYADVVVTKPDGSRFNLGGREADRLLSKIPLGANENAWALGYMSQNKLLENVLLREGIYDPGILKAIFMIGGPGSGKSYILQSIFGISSKQSFSKHGLKLVNPDPAFEKLLKDAGINASDLDKMSKDNPEDYDVKVNPLRNRAKDLQNKTRSNYVLGRLGMIVEGTGKSVQSTLKVKKLLDDAGYDTYMVYVNTTLDTARERNQSRDRTIPDDLLVKLWNDSQKNLGELQRAFGQSNTMILDNSENKPVDPQVNKAIERFINAPVRNPLGKAWMKAELAAKKS